LKTQSWPPCSSVPARFIASVLASCWCFVWRRGRPLSQITRFWKWSWPLNIVESCRDTEEASA
jgi:hypothetical protein